MPISNHIYLSITVPASILIPLSIGIYRYKNLRGDMYTIFYYLLLNGIVNILGVYLFSQHINNLPVLHIFTILEFLFVSMFYIQVLKDRKLKMLIMAMMIIFPLLCMINFIYFQDIMRFNTNTRPLEALFIIAYSLMYFAQYNEDEIDSKWMEVPSNWASTGLLLYFSGALFIFSFSNYTSIHNIEKFKGINTLMWNIHGTLVLFMYLLFTKGFTKCRTK